MAARIVSLLKDPGRARTMGRLGLKVVNEKFSCEGQVQRLEDLYQDLLPSGNTMDQRVITGEQGQQY